MNRRHFLRLGGSAAAALLLPRPVRCAQSTGGNPSLAAVAASRGLLFGASSDFAIPAQPPAYAELFRQHCRLLAPAYLSWGWVSPERGRYHFDREQPNLDFAQAHHMPLTGAHLLWQHRTPAWFQQIGTRAEAEKALVSHVAAMARRFRGRVFSWNVVNEAIEPADGAPDGLHLHDAFRRLFGTDYFDLAFHAAREADPNALLVYNDNSFEVDNRSQALRRRSLLALVDRLQTRKVPIQAVGLQSHLNLDESFAPQLYRRFLREVASRGVKILLTELDVSDRRAPAAISVRDRLVADRYSQFLDAALDEPAVIAVVTWGLSDRYTWLGPNYDSAYGRSDGLPCRPLLFDALFQPKPAFRAIAEALRRAPLRPLASTPSGA